MRPLDEAQLKRALELAERAIGVSEPNPRVGCVIGSDLGNVLGEGSTQQAGQAHAEVMALADARSKGLDVAGATAWVTLEPCSHFGRTPPCCDALIDAGLQRVVVAGLDPNPAVNGRGVERLRAAGVVVDIANAGAAIARQARELNIGFFTRMAQGRCWVRLKVACSLDGQVALADGRSQWITSPEARVDGHRWRRRAGAIVTGVGTVLADNPRLDVRLVPTQVQPLRVVLDSHSRMPSNAAILQEPGPVLVVHKASPGPALRQDAMLANVERLALPSARRGIDLDALLATLSARHVNEVHVEAGPRLNATFLQAGLVDEILLYQAPVLLGPGLPMARLDALPDLAHARRYRVEASDRVGPDLRTRLRAIRP